MAQNNGQSDVRLVSIAGKQLPGLLKMNEQGFDRDSIEVAEQGFTGLISSGQKKALPIELEYLTKRDSLILKYFKDWDDVNDARDVSVLHTDKSGDPLNAYYRTLYSDCELGPIKWPDFDQGARKVASLKITLYPSKPAEIRTL